MYVRCTMYFSAGFYAWTESYWYTQNVASVSAPAADTTTMVNFRVAMLGTGAQIDKVRLTSDQGFRQSYWLVPGQFNQLPPAVTAQVGLTNSDEPYSSITLRCQSADGYSKLVYVSGYPDGVVGIGFPTPPTTGIGPAWYNAYRAWAKELSLRWGWRRKMTPGGGQLVATTVGLQINALPPGEVGIVILNTEPAFNAGENVQLSGYTRIPGKNVKQLNGRWLVSSIDTTTFPDRRIFYLRNSSGIDVTQIPRLGVVKSIDYVTQGIFTVAIDSVTHRKRGVRSGRPLGKSRSRA